jgi:hypothetical protein
LFKNDINENIKELKVKITEEITDVYNQSLNDKLIKLNDSLNYKLDTVDEN